MKIVNCMHGLDVFVANNGLFQIKIVHPVGRQIAGYLRWLALILVISGEFINSPGEFIWMSSVGVYDFYLE